MQLTLTKIVLLFLALALLLGFAFNFSKIKRLNTVLGLFNPENIQANFIDMENIFPSHRVKAPSQSTSFNYSKINLLSSFEFRDTTWQTVDYLDYTQTNGLLVLKGDNILFEEYYKGYNEEMDFISWSVSKSFVSALVGIAVKKGQIESILDPVDKYSPILAKSGYKGVSIKDVLQMSSGIYFNEDYHDFFSDINKLGRVFALGLSFDKYVASLKSERKPGAFHNYVSMDTQVLGMVLKGATGQSLSKYMEENLWQPMGAEGDAFWLVDNKGMEGAFGGLNCRLRDYARFGKLYADNGFANGNQIISEDWIEKSTTATEKHLIPGDFPELSSHPFGYGYQWWIPGGGIEDFIAMGVYSQFIYVDPVNKIVIAKNSSNYHYATEKRLTTFRHLEFFRKIREEILNN